MTNSEQAIREFVEKYLPENPQLNHMSIFNSMQRKAQEEAISDLTALISEGYVSKEEYNRVVGLLQSQNPFPNRPNPRNVNPYDIGSVKRARRGH